MWLLSGSALGLTHMQRGVESPATLVASAPTVPVAPYQSVQEDAMYAGVFSQPPASASVAAAPKLGCGVGPGINTHSCASCPYAFLEGVPAAAVGLDGAAISICTACEAGGSSEISAFSAERMHPKPSCFGGVELSEAVARAKGKLVALENALPQDTRTMLRSFEQTIERSAVTGAMKEQLKELKSMAAQAMAKSEGCPVSSRAVSTRRLADGSVAPEPVPAPDALLGKFEAAVQAAKKSGIAPELSHGLTGLVGKLKEEIVPCAPPALPPPLSTPSPPSPPPPPPCIPRSTQSVIDNLKSVMSRVSDSAHKDHMREMLKFMRAQYPEDQGLPLCDEPEPPAPPAAPPPCAPDANGLPSCVEGKVRAAVNQALQDLGLPTPKPTPVRLVGETGEKFEDALAIVKEYASAEEYAEASRLLEIIKAVGPCPTCNYPPPDPPDPPPPPPPPPPSPPPPPPPPNPPPPSPPPPPPPPLPPSPPPLPVDGILDKLSGNLTETERKQYLEALKEMLGKSDDSTPDEEAAEERALEAEQKTAAAEKAAAAAQNATLVAQEHAAEALKKAEHAGDLSNVDNLTATPCAESNDTAAPTPTPLPMALSVSPRMIASGVPTSVSLASSAGIRFPPAKGGEATGLKDGCTAVFLLAGPPGCANATKASAGAGGVVAGMAVSVAPAVAGKYKLCISCVSPPRDDDDFARVPGTVLEATPQAPPQLTPQGRTLPV